MKNLKNLKGANELSKNEQKNIKGGWFVAPGWDDGVACPWNMCENFFGRCSVWAC